jgi:hypothetical protein
MIRCEKRQGEEIRVQEIADCQLPIADLRANRRLEGNLYGRILWVLNRRKQRERRAGEKGQKAGHEFAGAKAESEKAEMAGHELRESARILKPQPRP